MLKTAQVQEAMGYAVACIKKLKGMSMMKYPLTDKQGYKIRFYFTDATDVYYQNILGKIIKRKKNKIVEAPMLFCFEYDHKRDGWFIDNVPELTTRIEDLFSDYYKETVEPELRKRGKAVGRKTISS